MRDAVTDTVCWTAEQEEGRAEPTIDVLLSKVFYAVAEDRRKMMSSWEGELVGCQASTLQIHLPEERRAAPTLAICWAGEQPRAR